MSGKGAAGGAGGNPFVLPSDEEVFKMREEERRKKRETRHRLKTMKVWEKTTQSSRMGKTRQISDLLPPADAGASAGARHTRGLVAAATAAISNDRRREKENMADFIAKKREMFLVQMSLDTKREEIRKLEHKAHMKEEALKKSELMLEEDAIRFDAFLKENDKKAHEAIKNAEREAKLKQDKVQEIKKLKHAINVVQSDKSKCEEALADCQRYKRFLDDLTPREYFEEQRAAKLRRQAERKRAGLDAKQAQWDAARVAAEEEWRRVQEEERLKAQREGRPIRKVSELPSPEALGLPAPPRLEDEETESSGEDIPMFFKEPQQLLDIFTQLEEGNLFLIQNCQETEQQLEELKQQYKVTERQMSKQTAALKENIRELNAQIDRERGKAEALRRRVKESTGEDSQEKLLADLRAKVQRVYKECGFNTDANPSTLTMLTDLEGKLERLLSSIASMDEKYVFAKEKEKEKERRDRVRAERIADQQRNYELRLKKSMERSQAPAKKKLGKQVMFRSAPLKRRVTKTEVDEGDKQAEADAVFLNP
uniref:DUF4200 domain-containing protein n=1 Tax=Bicosoecida sp. CB-2014 TaxID=1486930 RepID=A0A7S1CA91_9STRA|mmetsp:Transcript_19178/g.67689  ORF Transcript_19178/g.67689 Transcript_19178/m.67689 type:complete len:540 (+) Transcript_19178:174-1793(+)|eukprot:CAMPEP_0203811462 /NCGR_PEP_ID=MMETSP0115-20131106/3577_1 /ASSEMBLY_ACC=CAM_ASM_000227 /TAXON_ID=33651 /ORGANISM="Bicosoecid sp, Strain ms1" /LENGTH=539 /DNA_ID=CAMNT_0050720287 /DNA_START=144 /DNA_END=1763 /DNA_ORIENTATION=+